MTAIGPAIWVLDPFGEPLYMTRTTGTIKLHVDTSRMKTESALNFFRPSHLIAKSPLPPNIQQTLSLYPSSGGYPIIWRGQMIGVFGVGGIPPSDEHSTEKYDALLNVDPDAQCAQAALAKMFPESLSMDCTKFGGCLQPEIDQKRRSIK